MMTDLIKLFIEKPLLAVVSILSVVLVYTTLGMFSLQSAVAGLEIHKEVGITTEQRVYDMHQAIIRIEHQVGMLVK
jgi:hypothetical protein